MPIRTLTPAQERIIDVMVRWVVDAGDDKAEDETRLIHAVRAQFKRRLSHRRHAPPNFAGAKPGEVLSIVRGIAVGTAVVLPGARASYVRSKVSYARLTTHREARFRVRARGDGCVLERLS